MCLPDCTCLVVTDPLVLAIDVMDPLVLAIGVTDPLVLAIGVMDPLVVRATDLLALGITDLSLVVRVTVLDVTDPLVNLIV